MLRRRFNHTCLSPLDLANCERVFDQVCADENLDPLDPDAEILAVMVVAIFRNAHTSERELLEAVRSRRQKAPGTEHQSNSRKV
ncbi:MULTISPECIES: hypothetical protein [unclassified Mesorhizobium]|uniref:hypothetical protein n=1 Tax=unclassified Mesorhizobium TaxID=325217 RepID=UPI000BAFAF0E|nr:MULTISPECIES: hypothetical protein [unclassified Mesorhizobium]PBB22406.1 hypothetical protein CK232_33620 [Mesorhizobium sp. WSM4304]PBB71342.1 hypothetical protein CK227_32515 [Mesorhizobium sp. WSM4308]PBC20233.1 hypothetical protein CK226_24325 [Mesorhizobium sp. WSM4311]TRC87822.1 hypothetical protein FJV80_13960 [Mesorhizobium sp. WSM4310]TRD04724.1 hypothetical protein FJV82_12730 [Mesorhizobium sp. WSM4305]